MTTTTVAYKRNALRLLEAAPIAWASKVDKMSSGERQEYARFMDDVAQRAARLSGYLEARGALGCGDNGHAEGVKASNNKVARVRKALGFTYPESSIHF